LFINEIHKETHKHTFGQYCDERARKVQVIFDKYNAIILNCFIKF